MNKKEQKDTPNNKSKLLKTFTEINSKQESIFKIPEINGIVIQHAARINKSDSILTTINFKPLEYTIDIQPDGQPYLARFPTNIFNMTYIIESSPFKIMASYPRKEALMEFSPIPSMLLQAKYHFSKPFTQFLSGTMRSNYATFHFQLFSHELTQLNTISVDFNVGTKNTSFLFQSVFLRKGKPPGSAFSLYHKWNRSLGSISTVIDGPPTLVLRYRRKMTDDFHIGTSIHTGGDLRPEFDFGYMYRYKKSTIRSLITSSGLVSSHFSYKITPTFRFMTNISLDHVQCSYKTGIALVWDDPSISLK